MNKLILTIFLMLVIWSQIYANNLIANPSFFTGIEIKYRSGISESQTKFFSKTFKSRKFFDILANKKLLNNKIERFEIKEIGCGAEKTVYKIDIIYYGEKTKTIKMARVIYDMDGLVYPDVIDSDFERTHSFLKRRGLFDNGILLEYFAQIKGENLYFGEYMDGEIESYSYMNIIDNVKYYLFFSSYNAKEGGLTFDDIRTGNIIVDGYSGFKHIWNICKIFDYPLALLGYDIKWKSYTIETFINCCCFCGSKLSLVRGLKQSFYRRKNVVNCAIMLFEVCTSYYKDIENRMVLEMFKNESRKDIKLQAIYKMTCAA